MKPWLNPSIKIDGPRVIQLSIEEFETIARGGKLTLPNKCGVSVDDKVYLKEHDEVYTGREIVAQVTESSLKEFRFSALSILDDKAKGKQNKRDKLRKHKKNSYNTIL